MSWKIAEAKQRFSEVVRRAEHEPQLIQNRDRVVAVVMSPAAAEPLLRGSAPPLRDALADIRRLASKTGYTLEVPPRADRHVAFDWSSDVPRRHKRHQ